MRLLKIDAGHNVSLTEDLHTNIPPYAILSHTWGEDEAEVTFRDLVENSGKDKNGYKKLLFCGQQATRDGLQYFWVDTCCIDRSSSTELSEAINSMFRWYRQAKQCYVYLSDCSTCPLDQREFSESRWFTRGWTLQELIAPRSVEFFTKEGNSIGSRKSLVFEIQSITGIPIQALQNQDALFNFGVDERMSWAKDRQTKREEDAVYCLLGIFDVHMPLIYGEGKKNATARLREEIGKRSQNDLRSSAAPSLGNWLQLGSLMADFFRLFKGSTTGTTDDRESATNQALKTGRSDRSRMTLTQGGSHFGGTITISSGVMYQGNTMNIGGGTPNSTY